MSDQQQNELLIAVGRLEGKMDSYQAGQKAVVESLNDHDKRLRDVENRWAWALGIVATISFAAPYIKDLLHK